MGLLDNLRETYDRAKWALTQPDDEITRRFNAAFDQVETILENAEGSSAIAYYATDRAAKVEPYFDWFRDICEAWDRVDNNAHMERDSLARQLEELAAEVRTIFVKADGSTRTPISETVDKATDAVKTAGIGVGALLVGAIALVLLLELRR